MAERRVAPPMVDCGGLKAERQARKIEHRRLKIGEAAGAPMTNSGWRMADGGGKF